jgi:hypothetical protein
MSTSNIFILITAVTFALFIILLSSNISIVVTAIAGSVFISSFLVAIRNIILEANQ